LGMKPQRSEPTMFIKKMTKKEVWIVRYDPQEILLTLYNAHW
jgi:hypothetical protein